MVAPGLPKEAMDDPFRPPAEPCTVRCLHCGQEYSSDQIVWRDGFWFCPADGCGGAGYQFDIHPLDSPLWGGGEDADEDENATDEELEGEEPSLDAEDDRTELEGEDPWDDFDLTSEEIESEEELMRRRQQEFRLAAEAEA